MTNKRAPPGSKEGGKYYRIVLHSPDRYTTFRIHDVGRVGHTQRLTGRRDDGHWETQSWLINKQDAHVMGRTLVPDDPHAKKVFSHLSQPVKVQGDIFRAREEQ